MEIITFEQIIKKIVVPVLTVIFILLIFILSLNIRGVLLAQKEINNEIKITKKKIAEYTDKKEKIEKDINNFNGKEKIEKIARDKLNLKKEGEETYKISE